MKQGTLTLPEHPVPHPVEKRLTIVCLERFMTLIADKSADTFIIIQIEIKMQSCMHGFDKIVSKHV